MKLITLTVLLAAMGNTETSPPEPAYPSGPEPAIASNHDDDGWQQLSQMLEGSLDPPLLRDRRLQRRIALCERCHSTDLARGNNYLPILQGQNRYYLARKILDYKRDSRAYHPMQAISQSLSLDDIASISDFYSNQSSSLEQGMVAAGGGEAEDSAGNSLQPCRPCHGRTGDGAGLIPDISGQNENYLAYRIREIARGKSRAHSPQKDAVTRCRIDLPHNDSARNMARILSLALDPARVIRGEDIYQLNCATCHASEIDGAPKPDDRAQWQQRLANGFRRLERSALLGKQRMPMKGGNRKLSRNQIRDAIHYMLSRSGLFSITAPK